MGINKNVTVNKVKVGPVQCYSDGFAMLGNQYWLFLAISLVGMIIGGLIPIVLYGPAFCGIALCFLTHIRGEKVQFDQLFKGFDYFMPSLIATLLYMGVMIAMVVPFMIVIFAALGMLASEIPALIVVAVIVLICSYIFWILFAGFALMVFMFAVLLIVDKGQEGPAAMRLAFAGTMKNFWGVLGASIVGQLLVVMGSLLCFIPGLLAMPIILAGHVITYQKIFGIEMVSHVRQEQMKNPYV